MQSQSSSQSGRISLILGDILYDIEPPKTPEYFHARFMIGYPDGSFKPDGSITRAETATILVRTMTTHFGVGIDRNAADISGRFSDVSAGAWYHDYISVAYRYGLVQGFPDGSFKPGDPVTREQLAAMLARTTDILTNGQLPYIDAADVSGWAFNYVFTVLVHDWMHGDAGGRFRPIAPLSRAEAAASFCRILGRGDTTARSIAGVIEDVRIFPDAANENMWHYFYIIEATNSHYFVRDGAEEVWTRVVE